MNIKVRKDRYLINDSSNWGTQYDNLATTLFFEFPEFIDKNGVDIPTNLLNKYIVFDIESEENQDLIIDNKYSIPYEITKLEQVTIYIKLQETSESEDISDKLIWISKGLTIRFNKGENGKSEITKEKLDIFNSLVTTLNLKTNEVDNLIDDIKQSVENGDFDGKDYILTEEDKIEITDTIKIDIQPTLNEIEDIANTAVSIAKGANQSIGFENYKEVVNSFNVLPIDTYRVGQNIYVKTKFVPDLWIYEVFEENIPYTYTNDEEFIELVNSDSGIRIGYYSLGALETQKVNLTEYVTQDEFNKQLGAISSLLDVINGEVI